jgi:hypothetical protein
MCQQNQAIHLQSETGQSFVVQLNGKAYSSSRDGYLVLPQVAPGDHTLVIGFPGALQEYAFNITVMDKPRGLSLKLAVDNSWSLFDLVEFTAIKGSIASPEQSALARVDELGIPAVPVKKDSVAAPDKPVSGARILKIFDKASAGGIDQVYVIMNGSKADTVALFIHALEEPVPKQGASNKPANRPGPLPGMEAITVADLFVSRQINL